MPSGKIHAANTISLAGTVLAASYFLDPLLVSNTQVVGFTVGVLSGLILSPDLDCDDGYIGLYFIRQIPAVGPLLSLLWKWYWKFYAVCIPHRHWSSHLPIVSTAIRTLYLAFPAICYLFIAKLTPTQAFWANLGIVVAGLALSDIYHIVADFIGSEWE